MVESRREPVAGSVAESVLHWKAETAAAGSRPEVAESKLYCWAETVAGNRPEAAAAFEESETAVASKSDLAAVLASEQCSELEAAAERKSDSERAVVSEQCLEFEAGAAANRPEEVAVLEQH